MSHQEKASALSLVVFIPVERRYLTTKCMKTIPLIRSHNYQLERNGSAFRLVRFNGFFRFKRGTRLTHSLHANVPPPRVAGCAVDNSAAVAVEKVLPPGHAVQLAGILGCGGDKVSFLGSPETQKKASGGTPTIIREPRVAFSLEVRAVELGALVFAEIFGSLRTVLRNTIRPKHSKTEDLRVKHTFIH